MSRRYNILAIFERKAPTLDYFVGETGQWSEVTKAFISLEQLNGREQLTAQRMQSLATQKVSTSWCQPMATVDTACRMKVRKLTPVNDQKPDADENFRIFGIESIANVREQNREIELMVVEAS